MIEAENLCKVFQDKKRGTVRAVDGVSFVCKPGQIYGLLGANGAGKTTTLRMLATILEPTDGTARVAGFDIMKDAQKVRANIGFLSTSTALYGRLSAHEMVQYFGRLHGLEDDVIDQRINGLFGRLEMNEFRDRRCDKLSTGMKQKTSIARTLIHNPQVMIFDEPTLGLDVMAARTIVRVHPRVPRSGQDRNIFDARDERSGKVVRSHRHHSRRKIIGGRNACRFAAAEWMHDLEEIFVQVVEPHIAKEAVASMSRSNILTVYRKELTDSLRDRRTLISMVVVPIVIFPLISVGMITFVTKVVGKALEEVPKVMILTAAIRPAPSRI